MKTVKFLCLLTLTLSLVSCGKMERTKFTDENGAMDFDTLKEKNPDIYAWLEIEGTDISYPVVQRAEDNTYYLTHNAEGKESYTGAIYTEDYNTTTFEDPVTVIYGNYLSNGEMFGSLQAQFSSADFLAEHNKLTIYLPEQELDYTIFAAIPYNNAHLLYYYDFTNPRIFTTFFDDALSSRNIEAVIDKDIYPEPDDHVVILSTCHADDTEKRYLVLAVQNSSSDDQSLDDQTVDDEPSKD